MSSVPFQYRDDVFWLPQNMDFRGRVYPLPPHLTHISKLIIIIQLLCMLKLSYIVYTAHNPTKNFVHLYNIIIRYIIMIDLMRASYGTILMTTDIISWYRHVTLLCTKFVYVNYPNQELGAWICAAKNFIMPYLTIHCTMISSKIKDQRHCL